MKRLIKFRGKRVNGGEWIESMTISYGTIKRKENCVFFEIGEDNWQGVLSETVGQFTGLLDKNGKEIYEGDVVECCTDVCKVVYSGHYAGFALDKQGWAFLHFFGEAFRNKDCGVIGNIHDNPELLKGGKE